MLVLVSVSESKVAILVGCVLPASLFDRHTSYSLSFSSSNRPFLLRFGCFQHHSGMSAEVVPPLDSVESLEKDKVRKEPFQRRPSTFHVYHKKHKLEDGKNCRFCRKRAYRGGGEKFLSGTKRRKKEQSIPPSKFLLGGNIRDPLNLNSLQDEEVNRRLNAVTPETSPMPTPSWKKGEVEVLIPLNIHDPLNLGGDSQDGELLQATPAAHPKRKKHKKRKAKSNSISLLNDSKSDESKTEDNMELIDPNTTVPVVEPKEEKEEPLPPTPEKKKEGRPGGSAESKRARPRPARQDKIVSPVVPQPGAWPTVRPRPHVPRPSNRPAPQFKETNKRFQYGNYNRYYGYRNAEYEQDPRVKTLESRKELFEGKEVLDIGCNTGVVTVAVARGLGARRVVGLELDRDLVNMARANLRRLATQPYPVSMGLVYGPMPPSNPASPAPPTFPHNISFLQGNYVLGSDVLVGLESPQFDTILCLSVTKWIHLNWGDSGVKRAFRRMFAQLKPGGSLVLEPQPFSSYKKKKNLTETTWTNFNKIELMPHQFSEFLLGEVGFSKCEVLTGPVHHTKGFQRPIRVYTKPLDQARQPVEPQGAPVIGGASTVGVRLSEAENDSVEPLPAEVQTSDRDARPSTHSAGDCPEERTPLETVCTARVEESPVSEPDKIHGQSDFIHEVPSS